MIFGGDVFTVSLVHVSNVVSLSLSIIVLLVRF